VRGQRGTGGALREGGAGGKNKGRRGQQKLLNRGDLSWHIALQKTYQATNGDSIRFTSMGKSVEQACVGNDENLQGIMPAGRGTCSLLGSKFPLGKYLGSFSSYLVPGYLGKIANCRVIRPSGGNWFRAKVMLAERPSEISGTLLCLPLLAATGNAQIRSGTITGSAQDTTGAVITDADVTVTN